MPEMPCSRQKLLTVSTGTFTLFVTAVRPYALEGSKIFHSEALFSSSSISVLARSQRTIPVMLLGAVADVLYQFLKYGGTGLERVHLSVLEDDPMKRLIGQRLLPHRRRSGGHGR